MRAVVAVAAAAAAKVVVVDAEGVVGEEGVAEERGGSGQDVLPFTTCTDWDHDEEGDVGSIIYPPTESELASSRTSAAEKTNWWERINLSAVECVDPGVVLSAPPFPFRQKWDREFEAVRRAERRARRVRRVRGKIGRG